MLEHMTEDGTLHWRCHNAACDPMSAHISHPEVQHPPTPDGGQDTRLVALPKCPSCGATTFLNIGFTPEHLAEPTIVRDANGNIASVTVNGPANLVCIEVEDYDTLVEDAHMAHLKRVLDGLHLNVEIPGMYHPVQQRRIKSVQRPAWLAHHLKLREMMQAHGKTPEEGRGT